MRERIDYFGNHVSQFAILTPYTEMRVLSRSEVELQAPASESTRREPPWETVREALLYAAARRVSGRVEFSYPSPYAPAGAELDVVRPRSLQPGRPLLAAAVDLMHGSTTGSRFDPAATSVATPVTRVLAERRGVCQDFAHLFIAALAIARAARPLCQRLSAHRCAAGTTEAGRS